MEIVNITPTGEKMTCRAGEKTKFQFSLVNTSGGPLRVGLDVRVDGDAGSWLSIEGSTERDLSEGISTTVMVEINPPKSLVIQGEPEKTFTFRLRAYDAQNNESVEDSSTVSVVVQAAEKVKKKCLWCWIAPVIAAVLIGIAVFIFWPGGYPDVIGKKFNDVESDLMEKEYVITLKEVVSDESPGIIIDQSPKGGASEDLNVDGKLPLELTISAISITVPNIVGKSTADAELVLETLGLMVGEILEEKSTTPIRGSILVLRTDPEGDTQVLPGTRVDLIIPSQSIIVPSVAGFSYSAAKFALEKMGLRVKAEYVSTGKADLGIVISHIPTVQSKAKIGDFVTLKVEKTTVKVPNVLGKSPSDAIKQLKNLGFEVKSVIKGSWVSVNDYRVKAQKPSAGTKLQVGKVVVLTYPNSKRRVGFLQLDLQNLSVHKING